MRLSTLFEQAGVQPLALTGADPEIDGTALDSRRIGPGDLFFAIRGQNSDGETYVDEAIRRGARGVVAASPRPSKIADDVAWAQVEDPRRAAALLSREAFGRPDEALSLVGVTGTNGKTTVTHLIESIGRAAGQRCGRIGSVGYAIDGENHALARTTPEAPELFRLLAQMRKQDIDLVAIEVSSHALILDRVYGARFTVGAFLNLSQDHLDFHSDEQSYFEAKSRLIDGLGADQRAVLPADTEHGRRLAGRTRAKVVTFGRSADADVRLLDEHCSLEGSSAVLATPMGKLPIRTFLLGDYNMENVVAAAACAVALELPLESIPAGVLALEGVPGRTERVERGQAATVLVDYAHTPEALACLLGWISGVRQGRTIVVFGCGGSRDRSKRPKMGRIAAELADLVWITSDNPRNEAAAEIIRDVREGIDDTAHAQCHEVTDRREAIRQALDAAAAGDVVVVAGKGHEADQEINNEIHPFDDRLVVAELLDELKGAHGRR